MTDWAGKAPTIWAIHSTGSRLKVASLMRLGTGSYAFCRGNIAPTNRGDIGSAWRLPQSHLRRLPAVRPRLSHSPNSTIFQPCDKGLRGIVQEPSGAFPNSKPWSPQNFA